MAPPCEPADTPGILGTDNESGGVDDEPKAAAASKAADARVAFRGRVGTGRRDRILIVGFLLPCGDDVQVTRRIVVGRASNTGWKGSQVRVSQKQNKLDKKLAAAQRRAIRTSAPYFHGDA